MPYRAQRLRGSLKYTIRAINNSSNSGSFCVFQQDPDLGVSNALPLVWFSKYVHPQTVVKFGWTTDYNFVWCETGKLVPGIEFDASQVFDADLQSLNQITLTYVDGAYNFINQNKGPKPGSLYIKEDGSIPPKQTSVGIGMSGSGTFAVQAQPNLNLNFTPHPKYYIAFGDYEQGEVLDTREMTNTAEVPFEVNIYSMTAILGPDNAWTISSTLAMNTLVAEARTLDPSVTFKDVPRLLDATISISLTNTWVFDPGGIVVFGNKEGHKKAKEIFVESVQPARKKLDEHVDYTVVGKTRDTVFGPNCARFIGRAGNTYKFLLE